MRFTLADLIGWLEAEMKLSALLVLVVPSGSPSPTPHFLSPELHGLHKLPLEEGIAENASI